MHCNHVNPGGGWGTAGDGRREQTAAREAGVTFERFTDEARRAVVVAQEEARELGHNSIGTEHLLLGVIRVDGPGGRVLGYYGVPAERVRSAIVEVVGRGDERPSDHIPFTPRAKTVLELSLREAINLGHDHIGSGHILLALLREGDGLAAHVLRDLLPDIGTVRERMFGPGGVEGEAVTEAGPRPRCPGCRHEIAEALYRRVVAIPERDEDGEPRDVVEVFCGVCGVVLGVLPA